jgi:CheY-like chemotaxis protein
MHLENVKRILYVDDDEDMLLLIKAVLEQDSSLQVNTYTSPILALADISATPPDLIILDYQIPEMNGTEIMQQIYNMDIDVPIIFFTAQSAPEEIDKIQSLGATKVIVKPVDISQLHEKLLLV